MYKMKSSDTFTNYKNNLISIRALPVGFSLTPFFLQKLRKNFFFSIFFRFRYASLLALFQ